ncbi:2',3'-cyclic-nucleotide 2'-phosphodiesterase / 3'-nucleotidase [Cetobacterium ceti]|uniref:2',3'-cyclic-nucleotide 2'-phosphodiesterase / 3'-nucleotidase n=1 Tax=Cetobacterium ceti TaxID=180163 RepID=A0A1T4MD45_9FUSO|nr:5'-nucleotidase C-terminal domain-containing protein [Cetobacterium ceti]SJZ64801.1 2',3'-cyclic-nucleotide 2'-phosphodiesterase / 3'-nucleotidase [Cetobacterium ceti]
MKDIFRKTQYIILLFLLSTSIFAKIVKIDIISFNDFHGNVAEDTREKGKNIGMAKMVGYVNEVKKGNPNVIVVSGGDNYQGTAISNLTFGAPVNRMMKAMKVTASAVGNHEFDWGSERIGKWAKEGNFDYLAANIYDKKTGKLVTWAKPYKVIKVDGIKIGIIGLATEETAYQTNAEFVKNIEFKPANEAAQYWVNYLNAGKDKMGKPDIIIAITHIPSAQGENKVISGEELNKLTKVKGISGIITGHSHRTVSGIMNGIPVIQAYKYGRALGRLHIVMEDGKIIEIKPSVDMVSNNKSDIIPDKGTEGILDKETKDLSKVLKVKIGKLNEDLTHDRGGSLSKLGYWATDAMRKAAHAQIGLTNGGGFRRTLYKGDITMGDMYEIMPFDNPLVLVKVTGAQLKKLIDHGIGADFMSDGQFAGVKVKYDPTKEYEHRVVSVVLEDGTPIKDNEIYTVATDGFLVSGGDRYNFKDSVEIKNLFISIRETLVDRVKDEKVVKVPNIDDLLIPVPTSR